jgi:hypothetical protein
MCGREASQRDQGTDADAVVHLIVSAADTHGGWLVQRGLGAALGRGLRCRRLVAAAAKEAGQPAGLCNLVDVSF